MALSRVTGEQRKAWVLEMIEIMVSQAGTDMSEEELKKFKEAINDQVKKTTPGSFTSTGDSQENPENLSKG